MHENSADGINNADNQLVAYLNDGLVYNKSHENNPPLNDVMDLSDKLIPGTNSLSIPAGGTVTHRIETSADLNQYSTFTFPASFTKLASLVWNQQAVVMTNLNVVASAGLR